MTKVEQAELLELGLTEAQVEQRAQKLSQILDKGADAAGVGLLSLEPKPTRKRRSDAGKPKARKAEAVPGVLTQEQANRLRQLIELRLDASEQKAIAEMASIEAHHIWVKSVEELNAYLDSLKGTA